MTNPLMTPWTGPFGGIPPFDEVRLEHFRPGLEAAMAERLEEIERIARDPSPPTFDNTLAKMERSGRAFDRASRIYGIYGTSLQSPGFQEIEREMEPRIAAFYDRIVQN